MEKENEGSPSNFNENVDEELPRNSFDEIVQPITKVPKRTERISSAAKENRRRKEQNRLNKRRTKNRVARKARKKNRKKR